MVHSDISPPLFHVHRAGNGRMNVTSDMYLSCPCFFACIAIALLGSGRRRERSAMRTSDAYSHAVLYRKLFYKATGKELRHDIRTGEWSEPKLLSHQTEYEIEMRRFMPNITVRTTPTPTPIPTPSATEGKANDSPETHPVSPNEPATGSPTPPPIEPTVMEETKTVS